MAAVADRPRRCPRCRYDLRAQVEPRCPECGLTFPAEDWHGGILREYLPARMDRVDPWQPHQVLGAGLVDMLHGLTRPHWVFTQLDPRGSLGQAVLAALAGSLWIYLASVVLVSAGIIVRHTVSPRAAVLDALFFVAPRILVYWTFIAGCYAVPLAAAMRMAPDRWARVRALLFLLPAIVFLPSLGTALIPCLDDIWGALLFLLPAKVIMGLCVYAAIRARHLVELPRRGSPFLNRAFWRFGISVLALLLCYLLLGKVLTKRVFLSLANYFYIDTV